MPIDWPRMSSGPKCGTAALKSVSVLVEEPGDGLVHEADDVVFVDDHDVGRAAVEREADAHEVDVPRLNAGETAGEKADLVASLHAGDGDQVAPSSRGRSLRDAAQQGSQAGEIDGRRNSGHDGRGRGGQPGCRMQAGRSGERLDCRSTERGSGCDGSTDGGETKSESGWDGNATGHDDLDKGGDETAGKYDRSGEIRTSEGAAPALGSLTASTVRLIVVVLPE